jgi:uncharacterized membrane protein HdeD (DUF308 family)
VFVGQLVADLVPVSAGTFLILFPAEGLIALTLLVGLLFLPTGIAQSAFALWARPASGWGWGIISAAVSVVLGGQILMDLREAYTIALGVLMGIDFLTTGFAMTLTAQGTRPEPHVWDA